MRIQIRHTRQSTERRSEVHLGSGSRSTDSAGAAFFAPVRAPIAAPNGQKWRNYATLEPTSYRDSDRAGPRQVAPFLWAARLTGALIHHLGHLLGHRSVA